jgi:hypothetical protein
VKKETAGRPNSDLFVISTRLKDAIDMNIDLVDNDNIKITPSFLKSENVGIYTLCCLRLLDANEKDFEGERLHSIVKDHLVPCVPLCKENKDLIFGASGFLHALLLLKNKLGQTKFSNTQKTDELLTNTI